MEREHRLNNLIDYDLAGAASPPDDQHRAAELPSTLRPDDLSAARGIAFAVAASGVIFALIFGAIRFLVG
jgi:hypothetical protein